MSQARISLNSATSFNRKTTACSDERSVSIFMVITNSPFLTRSSHCHFPKADDLPPQFHRQLVNLRSADLSEQFFQRLGGRIWTALSLG